MSKVQKISWNTIEKERLSEFLSRQTISGEKGTLAQFAARRGGAADRHSHVSEEYLWITSGALKFTFDDREVVAKAGEVLVIPPNVRKARLPVSESTLHPAAGRTWPVPRR